MLLIIVSVEPKVRIDIINTVCTVPCIFVVPIQSNSKQTKDNQNALEFLANYSPSSIATIRY